MMRPPAHTRAGRVGAEPAGVASPAHGALKRETQTTQNNDKKPVIFYCRPPPTEGAAGPAGGKSQLQVSVVCLWGTQKQAGNSNYLSICLFIYSYSNAF